MKGTVIAVHGVGAGVGGAGVGAGVGGAGVGEGVGGAGVGEGVATELAQVVDGNTTPELELA